MEPIYTSPVFDSYIKNLDQDVHKRVKLLYEQNSLDLIHASINIYANAAIDLENFFETDINYDEYFKYFGFERYERFIPDFCTDTNPKEFHCFIAAVVLCNKTNDIMKDYKSMRDDKIKQIYDQINKFRENKTPEFYNDAEIVNIDGHNVAHFIVRNKQDNYQWYENTDLYSETVTHELDELNFIYEVKKNGIFLNRESRIIKRSDDYEPYTHNIFCTLSNYDEILEEIEVNHGRKYIDFKLENTVYMFKTSMTDKCFCW